MNRIMFAATTSGTGKTTISSGIMRALKKRGLTVQPYKVGPDYIDTMFHKVACGVASRNLDEFMLSKEELKYIFCLSSKNADVSVVEGVMGLYDGLGKEYDFCSSSSMSKILNIPVILVIDGKSMAASAAALVLGYKMMDTKVNIAGVIVNNVTTESHYAILKDAIEKHTQIPVVGRVPKDSKFALSSRHLGLIPTEEVDSINNQLEYIAEVVEKYIDIDRIMSISKVNSLSYDTKLRESIKNITSVHLAIAKDKAFNFYYQDSLDLLSEMGVTIHEFSPLTDRTLPEGIHGIFLGGGYPEIFAKELSHNTSMIKNIQKLAKSKIPIYAECGGLMYLGQKVIDSEKNEYPMLGLLKGNSLMCDKLQRFGYCKGTLLTNTVIGSRGTEVKGHEFHYSMYQTTENPTAVMGKQMSSGEIKSWKGGYQNENVYGTYLHTHFAGNYSLVLHFIKEMENYRDKKQSLDLD